MIDRITNNTLHSMDMKKVSSYEKDEAQIDNLNHILNKLDGIEKEDENQILEELKEACNEFETYFIEMIFKEMRKTTHLSGEEKSPAEETFEELLMGEYACLATKSGGIGVSDFMYRQMEDAYKNQMTIEEYKELDR